MLQVDNNDINISIFYQLSYSIYFVLNQLKKNLTRQSFFDKKKYN